MRKSQEIRNRIVVADIFHHLFQKLQVRRVLPVFHPVSDLIAENPAEIFVAREREEAAGVGQHADEGGEPVSYTHLDVYKRQCMRQLRLTEQQDGIKSNVLPFHC